MIKKDFSDLAADIDRLRESVVQFQRRAVAQIVGQRRSDPPLGSPAKNPVSLLRWQWSRDAATLVPGSTEFHPFEREKNPNGPPYWLPDVPVHGFWLYFGIDPFPSWPDEEANYDLFYFLHQILQAGRLSGVFKAPPKDPTLQT